MNGASDLSPHTRFIIMMMIVQIKVFCVAEGWNHSVLLFSFVRVLHFGGNANNEANAGAFYWNSNNDSSNSNRNIGSQLAVEISKLMRSSNNGPSKIS